MWWEIFFGTKLLNTNNNLSGTKHWLGRLFKRREERRTKTLVTKLSHSASTEKGGKKDRHKLLPLASTSNKTTTLLLYSTVMYYCFSDFSWVSFLPSWVNRLRVTVLPLLQDERQTDVVKPRYIVHIPLLVLRAWRMLRMDTESEREREIPPCRSWFFNPRKSLFESSVWKHSVLDEHTVWEGALTVTSDSSFLCEAERHFSSTWLFSLE